MKKLLKLLKDPLYGCGALLHRASRLVTNDELYIRMEYFFCRKRLLHLKHPVRFNEKLQWLKVNDIREEYTQLVDKYEVKKIVAAKIGGKYVIPLLGVWNHFDEIDFDKLPGQFVLKCTHDSGGLVICTDKNKLDRKEARKKIEKSLKSDYFYEHREYPYRNVTPRVIAEKYMTDETGWQLKDYKIFCFNGEPKFIEVDYDRYVGHKLNVYDTEWNFVDFYMTSPNDRSVSIEKPERLAEMLDLARTLAESHVFVRVDFYSVGENIYFGEMTFHPGAGCIDFHPDEYDYILGGMLKLPVEQETS